MAINWDEVMKKGAGDSGPRKKPEAPMDIRAVISIIEVSDYTAAVQRTARASMQMGLGSSIAVMNAMVANGGMTEEEAIDGIMTAFRCYLMSAREEKQEVTEEGTDPRNNSVFRGMTGKSQKEDEEFDKRRFAGAMEFYDDWIGRLEKAEGALEAYLKETGAPFNAYEVTRLVASGNKVNMGPMKSMAKKVTEEFTSTGTRSPYKSRSAGSRLPSSINRTFSSGKLAGGLKMKSADMVLGATYGDANGEFVEENNMYPCHLQVNVEVDDDELRSYLDSWESGK